MGLAKSAFVMLLYIEAMQVLSYFLVEQTQLFISKPYEIERVKSFYICKHRYITINVLKRESLFEWTVVGVVCLVSIRLMLLQLKLVNCWCSIPPQEKMETIYEAPHLDDGANMVDMQMLDQL